jgi:hypothetical protein
MTPASRIRLQKRLTLLQAIRDGLPHTKANAVLAPLSQADLVGYSVNDNHRIDKVWLTDGGKGWVEFFEKELAE